MNFLKNQVELREPEKKVEEERKCATEAEPKQKNAPVFSYKLNVHFVSL